MSHGSALNTVLCCIHHSQNHCFTTMLISYSSLTLNPICRHEFYSHVVRMKSGTPLGAQQAVITQLTLPLQMYKIDIDSYEKFNLFSLQKPQIIHILCLSNQTPMRENHIRSKVSVTNKLFASFSLLMSTKLESR